MCAFDVAASRAGVEALDVLQALARHLPMASLHVGNLLLGNSTEDGVPDIRNQSGNRQRQRSRSQKRLGHKSGGGLDEPRPSPCTTSRRGSEGRDDHSWKHLRHCRRKNLRSHDRQRDSSNNTNTNGGSLAHCVAAIRMK